jgi:hypothetical protein
MKLMTKEIAKQLPPLYTNENKPSGDVIVHVKFFDPCGSFTWYATEFDGDDIFFGLVVGHEVELGYFSLSELESVRGRMGIGIERDLYWQPRPLREVPACPSWIKER